MSSSKKQLKAALQENQRLRKQLAVKPAAVPAAVVTPANPTTPTAAAVPLKEGEKVVINFNVTNNNGIPTDKLVERTTTEKETVVKGQTVSGSQQQAPGNQQVVNDNQQSTKGGFLKKAVKGGAGLVAKGGKKVVSGGAKAALLKIIAVLAILGIGAFFLLGGWNSLQNEIQSLENLTVPGGASGALSVAEIGKLNMTRQAEEYARLITADAAQAEVEKTNLESAVKSGDKEKVEAGLSAIETLETEGNDSMRQVVAIAGWKDNRTESDYLRRTAALIAAEKSFKALTETIAEARALAGVKTTTVVVETPVVETVLETAPANETVPTVLETAPANETVPTVLETAFTDLSGEMLGSNAPSTPAKGSETDLSGEMLGSNPISAASSTATADDLSGEMLGSNPAPAASSNSGDNGDSGDSSGDML